MALKATLEKAKKEKLDDLIAVQYQQLLTSIQKSEEVLLDKSQAQIKKLIQDELIKRYQYKKGLYEFYTKNNLEIQKATSLLSNSSEYKKILKM